MSLYLDPLPPPGPPPVAAHAPPCGACRFAVAPRAARSVRRCVYPHRDHHVELIWAQVRRDGRLTPLVVCALHDCIRFPLHYGCDAYQQRVARPEAGHA